MEPRRLRLLLELSRRGSMRAVADELGYTTSTVSEQLALLAAEAGTPLTERDGRRVRLTPAGRRLADHAVTILAAIDAAKADLDPAAEPSGTVRVASFASAIRSVLVPIATELHVAHPGVALQILESEPAEAFAMLAADDVDLALVYDYDLAPVDWRDDHDVTPLWDVEWGVGVPTRDRHLGLADLADRDWIVNSRHVADERALRSLAARAGFTPRVVHRIDSLELVDDLIVAGRGVGLLPRGRASRRGVSVLRLTDPPVNLRAYAVTRRGRDGWPPLRAVVERLSQ